jgi:hypothetical protein
MTTVHGEVFDCWLHDQRRHAAILRHHRLRLHRDRSAATLARHHTAVDTFPDSNV